LNIEILRGDNKYGKSPVESYKLNYSLTKTLLLFFPRLRPKERIIKRIKPYVKLKLDIPLTQQLPYEKVDKFCLTLDFKHSRAETKADRAISGSELKRRLPGLSVVQRARRSHIPPPLWRRERLFCCAPSPRRCTHFNRSRAAFTCGLGSAMHTGDINSPQGSWGCRLHASTRP
jgi:hypothetical protein